MHADVIIIGAGPAGLFASREIVTQSKLRVVVIDKGRDINERSCPLLGTYKVCSRCSPCNILYGVGGAGAFSGGIMNLRPDIGGNLTELVGDEKRAMDLINYVDQVFLQYGAPTKLYKASDEKVIEFERKAAAVGAKFVAIDQRLIGSDRTSIVIRNFKEDLLKRGVRFILGEEATQIGPGYVKLKSGRTLRAKYLLVAPGRAESEWLISEAKRLGIKFHYKPIDVGIRVEVPSVIMDPIVEVNRDPKIHIRSKTYDDFVRTFCVNHEGFVVQEVYKGFVGVNGHSFMERKSANTNFALLVRVKLTEPIEDSSLYGRTIAMQAITLGGGKPILQRLGDLMRGRRSTWDRIKRGTIQPTLTDVTPGDIAMVMPHRLVTDIIEALDVLDDIIPGVNSASTLLYAPEIKFPANQIVVNEDLETSVKNLFVAGDGAGLSRGLVTAAATGVLAARGILRRELG